MKNYLPIRILLADDHEIFRDGFRVMMKKQTDFELIGEASNGQELLHAITQLQPDVVVTDIKMPIMDGIEATKQIYKNFPQVGVIALSMFDEENLIVDMIEAGAKGYLLKNAQKEEIFDAIKTVYQNRTYFCNHTSPKLAKLLGKARFNPTTQTVKASFNERESEIIKMICQEMSNKEMAEQLNLSSRTIESHREKILFKMGVKNTAGIVIYAIRHHIFKI
jgi:DNA-binding NarL/FixJ family response regulator